MPTTEGIYIAGKKAYSVTNIETLDLLCEGPIDGIVSGDYSVVGTLGNTGWDSVTFQPYKSPLRSIFLNETPIMDEEGKLNFQQIKVDISNGGPNGFLGSDENLFTDGDMQYTGDTSYWDDSSSGQYMGEVTGHVGDTRANMEKVKNLQLVTPNFKSPEVINPWSIHPSTDDYRYSNTSMSFGPPTVGSSWGFSVQNRDDLKNANKNTENFYDFGRGNFTVEFWVWHNPDHWGTDQTYFSKGDKSKANGFSLGINSDGYIKFQSINIIYHKGDFNNAKVTPATWHHVALQFHSVDTPGQISLYLDGTHKGTLTVSKDGIPMSIENGNPLFFGRNSNANTIHFQGNMDDVRISNILRYSNNFTPAKTTSDVNTMLLLDCEKWDIPLEGNWPVTQLAPVDISVASLAFSINGVRPIEAQTFVLQSDPSNDATEFYDTSRINARINNNNSGVFQNSGVNDPFGGTQPCIYFSGESSLYTDNVNPTAQIPSFNEPNLAQDINPPSKAYAFNEFEDWEIQTWVYPLNKVGTINSGIVQTVGASYVAPTGSFVGGGQATAAAVITANAVTGITIGELGSVIVNAPGKGYTSVPTVTVEGGKLTEAAGSTDATATATLGVVVTLTAGGSGYTSVPTVSFSGGGGSSAAATAVVVGGVVTEIVVTNMGTGYTSSPTVSISGGGGTGATATAAVGVASITLTDNGEGYNSIDPTTGKILVPSITINGGGGSGALATAVNGSTDGGFGYTSAPTVVITDSAGSGATATANFAGIIEGTTITNGGSGYTGVPGITFSGGGGSGAAATATVSEGVVVDITVTDKGSGYTSAPTITFSGGGGSSAAATAILSGIIKSITVTAGGSSYSSTPIISFYGGGGSATATFTLSGGTITAVSITDGGKYKSVPRMIISDGVGTAADILVTLDTLSLTNAIASLGNTAGNNTQWTLYQNGLNKVVFEWKTLSLSTALSLRGALYPNQWNYINVIHKKDGTYKLFINGTQVDSLQTGPSKMPERSLAFSNKNWVRTWSPQLLYKGTTNFTAECWFYANDFTATTPSLFGNLVSASEGWALSTYKGEGDNWYLQLYTGAAASTTQATTTPLSKRAWYFVTVVRNGSTWTVYLNGKSELTHTESGDTSNNWFYMGDSYSASSTTTTTWEGYLFDVRVSNTARYSDNFDIPITKLANDSNTQFLLSPLSTHTSTLQDEATITQRSIHFDGKNDYLSITSDDFKFGTGDFTIEAWIQSNGNKAPNFRPIFDLNSDDTGTVSLTAEISANKYLADGSKQGYKSRFYLFDQNNAATTTSGYTSWEFSTNSWYHIAVTRSSGSLVLWVNGVSQVSLTSVSDITEGVLHFGHQVTQNPTYYWWGEVANLRVSNTARYTTAFDPPIGPFTSDSNTKLLIQPTETSTNYTDESSAEQTITSTQDAGLRFSPQTLWFNYSNTAHSTKLPGVITIADGDSNTNFLSLGQYNTRYAPSDYKGYIYNFRILQNFQASSNQETQTFIHDTFIDNSPYANPISNVDGVFHLNAPARLGASSIAFTGPEGISNRGPYLELRADTPETDFSLGSIHGNENKKGFTIESWVYYPENLLSLDESESKGAKITLASSYPIKNSDVVKYGSSSIYFHGNTNSYMNVSAEAGNNNIYNLAGSSQQGCCFTYEAWIYPNGGQPDNGLGSLCSRGNANGCNAFNLMLRYNNHLSFATCNADLITSSGSLPLNQWSHIACVANGKTVHLYINGVHKGSKTFSSWTNTGNQHFTIGRAQWHSGYQYKGWMDNIRMSNVVRYSSNFTPTRVEADGNTLFLIDFDKWVNLYGYPSPVDTSKDEVMALNRRNGFIFGGNTNETTPTNKVNLPSYHFSTSNLMKPWFAYGDGKDSWPISLYTDQTLSVGEWHHVAVSRSDPTELLIHPEGDFWGTFEDSGPSKRELSTASSTLQQTYRDFAVGNPFYLTSASSSASSIEFAGTSSNDRLKVGAVTDSWSPTDSNWCYETWFKRQNSGNLTQGTADAYIFETPQSASSEYINMRVTQTGSIKCYAAWGTDNNGDQEADVNVNDGQWHHIAFTCDITPPATLRIFVDGVVKSAISNGVGEKAVGSFGAFTAQNMYIGSANTGSSGYLGGTVSSNVKGYLNNFRISFGQSRYISDFTPPAFRLVSDSSTKLLLQSNTVADGNTSFSDSSSNAFTITKYGNTQHSTDVAAPYDLGSSINFYGYQKLLVAPSADLNRGTGSFTIEGWVYLNSGSDRVDLWSREGNKKGTDYFNVSASSSGVTCKNNGEGNAWNYSGYGATALTIAAWHHVAVVRNAGSLKFFVNGTEVTDGTAHTAITSSSAMGNFPDAPSIGYCVDGYSEGRLSELRYSDSARYASNFTVTTAPFESDPNALLLLHTDPIEVWSDNSNITLPQSTPSYGNLPISTDIKRIGTGSLRLDGAKEKSFSVNDNGSFDFGSSNFTLEGWYNFKDTGKALALYEQTGLEVPMVFDSPDKSSWWGNAFVTVTGGSDFKWTASDTWTIEFWAKFSDVTNTTEQYLYSMVTENAVDSKSRPASLYFYLSYYYSSGVGYLKLRTDNAAGTTTDAWLPSEDTWHHIAVNSDGTNTTVYADGSVILETSQTAAGDTANPLVLGSYYAIDGNPSAEFIPSNGFSGSMYGVRVSDNSRYSFSSTARSIALNGSTQYLSAADSTDWDLGSSNFTIEAWFKTTQNGGYQEIVQGPYTSGTRNGSNLYSLKIQPNGKGNFYFANSGTDGVSLHGTSSLLDGQWHHIAAVRNGSWFSLYIDGKLNHSIEHNITLEDLATGPLNIGSTWTLSDKWVFKGYLYGVRMSDTARYTADFTPAYTFSSDANTTLLIQPVSTDTNFHDESSSAHVITNHGTATREKNLPSYFAPAGLPPTAKFTNDSNTLLLIQPETQDKGLYDKSNEITIGAGITSLETLLVGGGGGGGGGAWGGGGGGGGVLYNASYPVTEGETITALVGYGGEGGSNHAPCRGTAGCPDAMSPTRGQDSIFGDMTAVGGGAGNRTKDLSQINAGVLDGGSGGGGGGNPNLKGFGLTSGGATLQIDSGGGTGYGKAGGGTPFTYAGNSSGGGGGGGAVEAGTDGSVTQGGKGGDGKAFTVADGSTSVYYGGGGGGSRFNGSPGNGGTGGGGDGARKTSGYGGEIGTDGLGGGGGAAARMDMGGRGGSGTVILYDGATRYTFNRAVKGWTYSHSRAQNDGGRLYIEGMSPFTDKISWLYQDNQINFKALSSASDVANYHADWSPNKNKWYHLSLVRDSSDVYLFVDGRNESLIENTAIATLPSLTGDVNIGFSKGKMSYFDGYLDELRISDSARYTDDDRHIEFGKVGGSTGYLSIPDSDDWPNGTSAWTVEFSVYLNTVAAAGLMVQQESASGGDDSAWAISLTSTNQVQAHLKGGGSGGNWDYTTTAGFSLDTHRWYHVAVVRTEDLYLTVYVDGLQYAQLSVGSFSINNSSEPLLIGTTFGSLAQWNYNLDGHMYDVRVSNTARYTQDFVAPTAKFTTDSNTKLLIQPVKSDTSFTDESSSSHTINMVGTVSRRSGIPYVAFTPSTTAFVEDSNTLLLKHFDVPTNEWVNHSMQRFGRSSISQNPADIKGGTGSLALGNTASNYIEIPKSRSIGFPKGETFTVESWMKTLSDENSIYFNGSTSSYLSVEGRYAEATDLAAPGGGNSWGLKAYHGSGGTNTLGVGTTEFWIKIDNFDDYNKARYVFQNINSSNIFMWYIWINKTSIGIDHLSRCASSCCLDSTWGENPPESVVNGFYYYRTSLTHGMEEGKWHHVALVSQGSTLKYVFIDGVEISFSTPRSSGGVSTDIGGTQSSTLYIGRTLWPNKCGYGSTSTSLVEYPGFKGYLGGIRMSNNARYTTAFTPSTSKFTNDTNTIFLLQPNIDTTSFDDESTNDFPITTTGSTKADASPLASSATHQWIMGALDNTHFDISYKYKYGTPNVSGFVVYLEGNDYTWSGIELAPGQWYHIALVRIGARLNFFVNGIQQPASFVSNDSIEETSLRFGIKHDLSAASHFQGKLDEVRIASAAMYKTNFTPPTTQFKAEPNLIQLFVDGVADAGANASIFDDRVFKNSNPTVGIGGVTNYQTKASTSFMDEFRVSDVGRYTKNFIPPTQKLQPDDDTVILLHSNVGSLAEVDSFYDLSAYANTITAHPARVGSLTPVHSTDQAIILNSSIYFDNPSWQQYNGDYLVVEESSAFNLGTENFTIEAWIYLDRFDTEHTIISNAAQDGTGWIFMVSTQEDGNGLYLYSKLNDNSTYLRATYTFAPGLWYHVAAVREDGTLRMYIDGVQITTGTPFSGGYSPDYTAGALVGAYYNNATAVQAHAGLFDGYIDQIRISNVPRYTSGTTFTPPKQSFELDGYTTFLLESRLKIYSNTPKENFLGNISVDENDKFIIAENIFARAAADDYILKASRPPNTITTTKEPPHDLWSAEFGSGRPKCQFERVGDTMMNFTPVGYQWPVGESFIEYRTTNLYNFQRVQNFDRGVTAISISEGGSGYTTAPTIALEGGNPTAGQDAAAEASVVDGAVTSINITKQGTQYLTAPTIKFTGGGGSGAEATATIDDYFNGTYASSPEREISSVETAKKFIIQTAKLKERNTYYLTCEAAASQATGGSFRLVVNKSPDMKPEDDIAVSPIFYPFANGRINNEDSKGQPIALSFKIPLGTTPRSEGTYYIGIELQKSNTTLFFDNISLTTASGFPLQKTRNIGERLRGPTTDPRPANYSDDMFAKKYRIINKHCVAAELNIKIQQLYSQGTNGDLNDASISNIIIHFRPLFNDDTSSYVEAYNEEISGVTSQGFIKKYVLDFSDTLASIPTSKRDNFWGWEIKVHRTAPESTTTKNKSITKVDSLTEIYETSMCYPNSAVTIQEFSAEYFSNFPSRSFDTKMLKVKIPNNYDPIKRTYDESEGPWNGLFKEEKYWTNNPAWCFYDLVTNDRYGLGKYIPEEGFDKWTLYKIAQYCDVIVPDGNGGMEPRFVCDVIINKREDAYKVMNDMASCFRGILYYAAGQLYAVQDSAKLPIYSFTNANVQDGDFRYSNTSRRDRHNVCIVRYNDKNNFYRPAIEYVEDIEGIKQNGIRETDVSAFGASSRGQALRLGKWLTYTENLEIEVCEFRAGIEGAYLKPGDIISITDTNRLPTRRGGRTFKVGETNIDGGPTGYTQITLDSKLEVDPNKVYNLSLLTPTYSYDSYNVSDLNAGDTKDFRRSQVQDFLFSGNMASGITVGGNEKTQITFSGNDLSRPLAWLPNFDGSRKILNQTDYIIPDQTVFTVYPTGEEFQYGETLSEAVNVEATYRITDIDEQEKQLYKIKAVQNNPKKYQLLENDLAFEQGGLFNSPTLKVPDGPSAISLDLNRLTPNTVEVKYAITPPAVTDGLDSYHVFIKEGEKSFTVSDFTGNYPNLWSEFTGSTPTGQYYMATTSIGRAKWPSGEMYVPDVRNRLAVLPAKSDTTRGTFQPLDSGMYAFKAFSTNALGEYSALSRIDFITIPQTTPVMDVQIKNLRLSTDTQLSNKAGTADAQQVHFTGGSPTFKWTSELANSGIFPNANTFRITVRPQSSSPTKPNQEILYERTGYEPKTSIGNELDSILSGLMFTYDLTGNLLHTSGERRFDLVVEAHDELGRSSAGGYIDLDSSYQNASGYDIVRVENPSVSNPYLSADGDECGVDNDICTSQIITLDNKINLTFKKNNYQTFNKDIKGAYIYLSTGEFASSGIEGKKLGELPSGVQRIRVDYNNIIEINPTGDMLLNGSVFMAYSLYDSFDQESETVYHTAAEGNPLLHPDYDLASMLDVSTPQIVTLDDTNAVKKLIKGGTQNIEFSLPAQKEWRFIKLEGSVQGERKLYINSEHENERWQELSQLDNWKVYINDVRVDNAENWASNPLSASKFTFCNNAKWNGSTDLLPVFNIQSRGLPLSDFKTSETLNIRFEFNGTNVNFLNFSAEAEYGRRGG